MLTKIRNTARVLITSNTSTFNTLGVGDFFWINVWSIALNNGLLIQCSIDNRVLF